jgi:hypothetical protein
VRGEHGETDAQGGEHVQRLGVDGRLGEPHPDRLAAEAPAEVRDAPADLGHLVAARREREDRMVVGHRDRIAVPVMPLAAQAVGLEHGRVGLGRLTLQPLEQRRPEIEADRGEGVDDPRDAPVRRVLPRRDHGAVAFPLDTLVPVVERGRRRLGLDLVEPRVLARRLVEMPVDDD